MTKKVELHVQARVAELNDQQDRLHTRDFGHACDVIERSGIDPELVVTEVERFSVSLPTAALAARVTRSRNFEVGGEPRNTTEKIDDVAALNILTGANKTISLHVPSDATDDPSALRAHAQALGIGFAAMSSNTVENTQSTTENGRVSFAFGGLGHSSSDVRKIAVEHNRSVIDLGAKLGAKAITVWLADGLTHPGQADFRQQFNRVLDGLCDIYMAMPADWTLFTEHRLYDPALYSTVNDDWGTSLLLAQGTGQRVRCLVDLGHQLPMSNVEQIVSRLAMVNRLGGIHFSDATNGAHDLTVGSIKPFQLFLIFLELIQAGNGTLPEIAFMVDQSNPANDPLEDLIQATEATQIALAQAMCVNRELLTEARDGNDLTRATELLHSAFRSDVRPFVAEARRRNGAALDPLGCYREIGYRSACIASRGARGTT